MPLTGSPNVYELGGAKGVPDAQRRAVRGGSAASQVVLGGQRIAVRRPRARSVTEGELSLPSFEWAANGELARRQLSRLASSLQAKHPGAAASLREGLEATLTVPALGITGVLQRTLRTTNPIENLNGSVARYCRNVKRWGDGQMVLRWVASSLSDAAGRMRKLRGCTQMRSLLKALDARRPEAADGATLKAG